ncbi:MAG: phenylalanine--tRNA ligase subunit beta [Candidatus Micrarchaeota archaeon]
MVVVEYSYEEMKKLIDLPKDQIILSLSELGAPSEYEPETKKIITELTPNRPDWYSMEGLARALRAYHNKKIPKYKTNNSDYVVVVDKSVNTIRPYTVCAVVKGLCFDDQKIRDMVLLQEKLLGTLGRKVKKFGLGVYPLGGIVFPVKYTTKKPGEIKYRPLGHEKEMSADEILNEHKKGQEYGHLLKGKERYPVFIDANEKMMALIPVVNSAETGKVDETTKEIFIEVTGSDLEICKSALNILVCTFSDMGGSVYDVLMKYEKESFITPNLKLNKMKLDTKKVVRILGIELKQIEIEKLLKKMGYDYEKGVVSIPPYRADILGEIDIIEDIAIAYGYNNFIPTVPGFFTVGNRKKRWDYIDDIMRGMGFLELKTFTLTNKERLGVLGLEEDVVEIENPNNIDYCVVRPSLIGPLLEVFTINKMKPVPQKFYEIGEVHQKKTKKRLVFGIMDKTLDFSGMRGYLQTVAVEAGLKCDLEKKENSIFESETSCVVLIDKKEVGVFGKVKQELMNNFGLDFDIYICELEI